VESAYSAVRTESLYIKQIRFVFKGLNKAYLWPAELLTACHEGLFAAIVLQPSKAINCTVWTTIWRPKQRDLWHFSSTRYCGCNTPWRDPEKWRRIAEVGLGCSHTLVARRFPWPASLSCHRLGSVTSAVSWFSSVTTSISPCTQVQSKTMLPRYIVLLHAPGARRGKAWRCSISSSAFVASTIGTPRARI
jgi:hypothetical protein